MIRLNLMTILMSNSFGLWRVNKKNIFKKDKKYQINLISKIVLNKKI